MLCTARHRDPGSMRAFADAVLAALDQQAQVEANLFEIADASDAGVLAARMETLLLPVRAFGRRRHRPDVWHILDGSRAYIGLALGAGRLVVTAHDVIPCLQAQGQFVGAPPVSRSARALWRLNGRVFRRANRVHCVSGHTAADLSRTLGVSTARCEVAGLPLRPDLSALGPVVIDSAARVPGRVMHVGNNSFYKNRTQVLRVFARMDASVAGQLLMLGPSPTAGLQSLVSELGLQSRVRWVIDPAVACLRATYLSAQLMLFPSCYEGFGWPALEAMVHGCPLLASDQGSLPEVVGQGGRCLALDDLDGWARAGSDLLANAAHWQQAQGAGLARGRQLLAQDFGTALTAIYRQACA